MTNREALIQHLHRDAVAKCPEPPTLAGRAPCVREYYERLADSVIAFLTKPRPMLIWQGCCDACGWLNTCPNGQHRMCQKSGCIGLVRPRIVEVEG